MLLNVIIFPHNLQTVITDQMLLIEREGMCVLNRYWIIVSRVLHVWRWFAL